MNRAPAAPLLDSGTNVGAYVVERQIAIGGMSVLYVARDREGTRLVIKMIAPDLAAPTLRSRLLREARALAAVDHPGVVRVRATGEHGTATWIAMDLVPGVDLKRYLAERGPFDAERALEHIIAASEALAAAHDVGVVHRDLKPSNLLLTPEGQIVLVDFGIAKRRSDTAEDDVLTSAHELFGTPAYLSPEQLEHGLADERSDVWALGCVLFELVSGAPPFGAGGPMTTAAILRDEPVFFSSVPMVVRAVISACLRKSSFARVASPRELIAMARDALDELRNGAPGRSRPSPPSISSSTRISVSSARPTPMAPSVPSAEHAPASQQRLAVGASVLRVSGSPKSASTSPPPSRETSSAASAPFAAARRKSGFPSANPATEPPPRPSWRAPGVARGLDGRGRIKGAAVRAMVAWFADAYGGANTEKLAVTGSQELRDLLRPADPLLGIMASGWYDTQRIGELIEVMERIADPPDRDRFLARLAEAVARDNVQGVYRALFRLIASPQRLESNAQRVWRMYFDEGTLEVEVRSPGLFEARVQGWTRHHPSVCRFLRSFLEHSLRDLGYEALLVSRTRCTADAGGACVFHGRWNG